MRFRVKIALPALAFVTAFLPEDAAAQTYFTAAKSGITSINTPVSGACQDYNNQWAAGVAFNGVNHPGSCQFSSGQIIFNGLPFDQYWQAVSIGAVPPPFKLTYTRGPRFEQCATLVEPPWRRTPPIEVSMHIPTSRLDWSAAAASAGPSCQAEWTRHNLVTLATDTANFKAAVNIVQQLVNTLNTRQPIPKKYRSCASVPTPEGGSIQKQILDSFVTTFKNAISNDVKTAEASFSPQGVSNNDCNLHCGVCSPGWAGLLTCTQQGHATGGAGDYHETQSWYVGGTSGNVIAAPWTAVGGGSSGTGGGWNTNNADQAPFTVVTDPTGNVTIVRQTRIIKNPGIIGSGGAVSSSDNEYVLPAMKTTSPNPATMPQKTISVYSSLPYTDSNNGPALATPMGTFVCQGTLNLQ